MDEPTKLKSMHRWWMATTLLLACLPLWGNGPDLKVDEAHSAFRVVGTTAKGVTLESRREQLLVLHSRDAPVSGVSLSADGRIALSGPNTYHNGIVRLWDAATGKLLRTMVGHESGVGGVSLSADGRIALSGGLDKTVRLWDATNGRLLRTMKGHTRSVNDVALSADGHIALSGGADATARVWDATTGKLLHTMEGDKYPVMGVSLSADGRIALSGNFGGTIQAWDTTTVEPLRTMRVRGYENSVNDVSLSADGRIALTGGSDRTVRLWNVTTGKLLRTMRGHEDRVRGVSLSADGRIALSGGRDHTVRLWNAATGKLLHTMRGHEYPVFDVSLSADGRIALSGGWGRTVRVWGSRLLSNPQSALHQAIERYAKQAMEAHIGPAIPKPALPPVIEYEKDPFETMAMFEQRIPLARAKRERQIRSIQARYRTAVEKRNSKIRDFEKNHLQRIRLTAHAKAIAEVFGHPVLKALHDENGNPKYEPEANPPRMHATLQFQYTKDSEDWMFEVPPGEAARDLYAALEAGEVSAMTEYHMEGDVLSLVAVHARYGKTRSKGIPADRDGSSVSQPVVRVFGQDDRLSLPKQQNPNLKDVAFEQYEVQQHREFDNSPSHYEKTKPDSHK